MRGSCEGHARSPRRPCSGSIFLRLYRVIDAVRCINGPPSRKSHFCVPLVTITFKTWVFRNFAMERPSRFASFESSDSQNSRMDTGPMLRSLRLVNPFETTEDRVTQDRVTQDRPQPIERKVINRAARSTPVCAACGSDDIICHATAQWSNEAQEWQLA